MLLSLALIFLTGMLLGGLCGRIGLPPLLGMLLAGILIGPSVLNLLDGSILAISPDLRKIALLIILLRAGLKLNPAELRQVGRATVLLCFLPSCFEIAGMVFLAPRLLGLSTLEAAIMGCVVAAASPAVIVPRMLLLMERGYGKRAHIPQMIMAASSMDAVVVVVLFTAFTGIAVKGRVSALDLAAVPLSMMLGIIVGILCGLGFVFFLSKVHMRDSVKVILILSVMFLLAALENHLTGLIRFSGLIAVMLLGVTICRKHGELARRLSAQFERLWVALELLLFVLVGASVNLQYAASAGLLAAGLILLVLVCRMLGVLFSLFGSGLRGREVLFCLFAYAPKATVQAAIGAMPLTMGLACGELVLTIAVLSILITAPLGAVAMDRSYRSLLQQEET